MAVSFGSKVALTQKNNMYETSSAARKIGLVGGASIGAYVASRPGISETISQAVKNFQKSFNKKMAGILGDGIQDVISGRTSIDEALQGGKVLKNIAKYSNKMLDSAKKHPVALAAVAGAAALFVVGAIADSFGNMVSYARADKQAKEK